MKRMLSDWRKAEGIGEDVRAYMDRPRDEPVQARRCEEMWRMVLRVAITMEPVWRWYGDSYGKLCLRRNTGESGLGWPDVWYRVAEKNAARRRPRSAKEKWTKADNLKRFSSPSRGTLPYGASYLENDSGERERATSRSRLRARAVC